MYFKDSCQQQPSQNWNTVNSVYELFTKKKNIFFSCFSITTLTTSGYDFISARSEIIKHANAEFDTSEFEIYKDLNT